MAWAQTPTNLTPINFPSDPPDPNVFIAAGDAKCPDQPYFRYSGGRPDEFAAPADAAFPSANLLTFMTTPPAGPSQQGVVAYDVPMLNGFFGDSFNLQNLRTVCHAVIMFRAAPGGGNDALAIGHITNANTFMVAAQVLDNPGAAGFQAYEFNATGLALLSNITSGPTPLDSVLDIFLQDDTMIDFIQLWVWHGPGVTPTPPTPLCSGIAATIVGTSGNDNITGTGGNDVIVGLDGNDAINGGGGNDVICGDGGRDILGGGPGSDTLDGGIDIDTLNGGPGNDTLRGGSANDILRGQQGQQGNDSLDGGSGNDICLGGPGNDTLVSCNP